MFATMTGFSREEALASSSTGLRLWVDEADRDHMLAELRAGRAVVAQEHSFRRKTGEVIIGVFSAQTLRLDNEVLVLSSITDITEASRSHTRFKAALSSLNYVIWSSSLCGTKVLDVNAAFERVYGRTTTEFEANPGLWIEAVHPEDRSVAGDSATRLSETGRASAEYRIVRPEGAVRWLADSKAFVCDAQGNRRRMGGVARDITEYKLGETNSKGVSSPAGDAAHELQAEGQILRRHADLLRLFETMTALVGAKGVTAVLDIALICVVLPLATDLVQAAAAFFMEGGALRLGATIGPSQAFLEAQCNSRSGESPCGQAVHTGEVIASSTCTTDGGHIRCQMTPHGCVVIPLVGRQAVLGVLCLNLATDAGSSDLGPWFLRSLGASIGMALENAQLYEQVERLSLVDPVTGLSNRRAYDGVVARVLANATRIGEPFSLLMIDCDHFKEINDRLGHLAGDRVLKEAAGIIAREIREVDLAARFGGDEFIVLLPELNSAQAHVVAQRLWKGLQQVTRVSIGVAQWDNESGQAGQAGLLRRADEALYRAKENGRNRIEVAPMASRAENHPARLKLHNEGE